MCGFDAYSPPSTALPFDNLANESVCPLRWGESMKIFAVSDIVTGYCLIEIDSSPADSLTAIDKSSFTDG